MLSFKYVTGFIILFLLWSLNSSAIGQQQQLEGWETNTNKALVPLNSLKLAAIPKTGIPSINNPKFVTTDTAKSWISAQEPVIMLKYQNIAKAYPLQILIWHEIVNDRINGEPVLVTFCPLCYSALVFKRTVDNEVLKFGVSGFLRHSDMVMYDHKTETLWQQFTGRAIIGDYVGTSLEQIPSQIISFKQFRLNFPDGEVLSRNTGYQRNYGSNPYAGYDDINNTPLLLDKDFEGKLRPMEKVVGVKIKDDTRTYPYHITQKEKIINDKIHGTEIVVFHLDGARSALDAPKIAKSREDGTTGVFKRTVDGRVLTFELRSGNIYDTQTESTWSITGKATAGPLKGQELEPVIYGDYFAFAWLVFWPETKIYQ